MKLEEQLEMFRTHYPSAKCTVFSDGIVYKTARGFANNAADNANHLIETLELELTAIPTTLMALDSFFVKSIYTEI